jgi:CRP-like cAMP-binding protein
MMEGLPSFYETIDIEPLRTLSPQDDTMTKESFLTRIPLFYGLRPEEAGRLAANLRHQTIKKGDALFRKGAEGNALYIIQSGRIKISLTSRDGDEVILAMFSDGDFFGEMALLDGQPRSADAVAQETTVLLVLNRTDFLNFLSQHSRAVQSILEALSLRLRKTDDLLEDTCFLNVSSRFSKKLVELAESFGKAEGEATVIDLGLTQTELASMVGASRESINKELKTLREKGLVGFKENAIRIPNLALLKRRIL